MPAPLKESLTVLNLKNTSCLITSWSTGDGSSSWRRRRDSPLGVKDAKEGGAPPVLTRQRENGPQVVEGDVALGQRAIQPGLLEGGPLLLQGPSAAQVTLVDGEGNVSKTAPLYWSDFTALGNHGFLEGQQKIATAPSTACRRTTCREVASS